MNSTATALGGVLQESNRQQSSSTKAVNNAAATARVHHSKEAVLHRLLSDDPPGQSPLSYLYRRRMDPATTPSTTSSSQLAPTGTTTMDGMVEADMSLLSMESKDETAATLQSEDTASDCEVSTVAQKRAWLDDFSRQQRQHYEQTTCQKKPDSAALLDKPTRPKVAPAAVAEAPGPTPLPKQSAAALVQRIEPMSQKKPSTTTGEKTASKPLLSARKKNQLCLKTPSRIPPETVQATDEGYASVAQLSAWLADDPTSTTKPKKVIRRGKNVLAKSRRFDKGLVNVVVQETHLRTGHVQSKLKELLQASSSSLSDAAADDDDDDARSLASSKQWQWPSHDDEGGSSVADKKAWLSTAFGPRDDENDEEPPPQPRATTEIVTSQDAHDLSVRAKQLWRQRTPSQRPTIMSTPSRRFTLRRPATESKVLRRCTFLEPPPNETEEQDDSSSSSSSDNSSPVDFQAARDLLVQRSRDNGNSVNVLNKVRWRKAKLEHESYRRRQSTMGLLKPSWSTDSDDERPSHYIKKYVDDVAPKKSLDDLP